MAGTQRCDACGHEMPVGSRVCLLCGREVSAQPVELEPLDEPRTPSSGGERVVTGTPARRDRRGLLAIGAGIVVLLAIVGVLASGGGGDDEDDADNPAEAAADTTTTTTSTTPSPPTTRARPTRSRPTTTTLPSTVVESMLGEAPAPVLGTETGGLSLYVAFDRHIARIELDTGRVTTRSRAFDDNGITDWMQVVGDALVAARGTLSIVMPRDLSAPPEAMARSSATYVMGANAFDVKSSDRGMTVTEVGPLGPTGRQWELTNSSHPAALAALGDRLLIAVAGRLYLVSPDGEVEQYAIGTFVAANNGWVLWHGCDERLTCQLHVGDAHDASRHALRWTDTAYPYPASLAPDGASALLSRSEYTFETEIVQLTTGRTAAVLGRVDRVAWSPDGAWAFAAVNDGIVAVSTRDGRRVDILSPFTTVIPSEQMQLAVG